MSSRPTSSSRSAHSHEGFAASAALESLLRKNVRGEVRFDAGSRALYSTDSSNYRQVPLGVVLPLDIEDVVTAVAACREFNAPLLSRGGGTSLAGQCCNVAVVLDFSKYLNQVTELDAGRRNAWVQPGVVLDELRRQAEAHCLTFAPDPATHSRCTIGGMIGNNSCGVHALMGGKTVDNIEELDVLLYDGTRMRVGATTDAELDSMIRSGGRRGELYAGLRRIRDQYAHLVRERFPDIPRRVSGYNLDQLLPENGFHVARALVGTEGTCVTVLRALCALKPSPQCRRLVVLGFTDAFIAADHVPAVLAHAPIGLEGFDGRLVRSMLKKNLVVDDVKLLPQGDGFLLCEFGANSDQAVEAAVDAFLADAKRLSGLTGWGRYTVAEALRIWKVREAALGASVFVPGEPSGWEGWEDSAVRPGQLGAYLRELNALMRQFGYVSPMYGHFGQGCVHLRISFDLQTNEGVDKYSAFIDKAADLVLRHGGSFSGEHGDGQARAHLLPKMFGPELMRAFAEFKALWDPGNCMNPGKLIDPVAVYHATENLRIGPGYKPAQVETWFRYPADQGSFAEATTRCVGVGACRKRDHGVMCPSYMVTLEEKHSTRGRARLLWEMLQGGVLNQGWRSPEVKEALDLCLSCKACKTECPVNVDMATWKAEFFAHYYQGRLHPLSHYAFGFMDRWAHLGSHLPWLANLPGRLPGVNSAVKKLLGIAPQRSLPLLAGMSFRKRFLAAEAASQRGQDAPPEQEVLLWADTWNNYFQPQALASAARLLHAQGKRVRISPRHICCGRPLYDFGFLDEARRYLRRVLTELAPQIDAGIPVVMLEPSCASVFRDELLNFFPHDDRAKRLSLQTQMLSDVLCRAQERDHLYPEGRSWTPPQLNGRRILVQAHCHQRAVLSLDNDLHLLRQTSADVELLDSGCCGMAGPFGFEKKAYAVSQALGERVLLPNVRAAAPGDLIVANGFSCREQVAQNSQRRALHLAEVLDGAPERQHGETQ